MKIITYTTRKFPLVLLLILLFITNSCKKPGAISYPTSFNYGENLLGKSTSELLNGESYSLEANLTKRCDLKIVITNLSEESSPGVKPRWNMDYITGWTVGNYNADGTQSFTTLQPGTSDLQLVFIGTTPGKCQVDFYENSGNITNTKVFTW